MESLGAAVVQFEHASGDKSANFAKIESFANRAAGQGVRLLAFPECCITGYWFLRRLTQTQLVDLAEEIPGGQSSARIRQLSGDLKMTIGAGLVERDPADGRLYNSYVVAMPDGTWARHRKIQAFESDHITPGSQYTVFDTPHGWRVGILICYDNNIIENARITALMGADLLLSPHQTGGCNSASPHGLKPIDRKIWANRANDPEALRREFQGDKGRAWIMRWLPARAHDNGMFLLFANGVGQDDDEVRTGNAVILDPYGRTIVESRSIEDDMICAELDPGLLDKCTGRRWMLTRRPDLYTPLVTRTGRERSTRSVRFEK